MIGILDSGIGGLTIYQEIKSRHPEAGVIYYADQGNFPYGEKTEAELLCVVRQAVTRLIHEGATVIVLACNTATVAAAATMRHEFMVPIVGIEPAVKQAASMTRNGLVGVMATKRTTELHEGAGLASGEKLCKIDASKLVAKIETDLVSVTHNDLSEVMDEFTQFGADTVVLGCTHFSFVADSLKELYPEVIFLEPTVAVVNRLETVMQENKLDIVPASDIFLCSAQRDNFQNSLKQLLGMTDADIREI